MNPNSRRLMTPSPRSISRRRIAGLIQRLNPLSPTEKAGAQRRSRDDFESSNGICFDITDGAFPARQRGLAPCHMGADEGAVPLSWANACIWGAGQAMKPATAGIDIKSFPRRVSQPFDGKRTKQELFRDSSLGPWA